MVLGEHDQTVHRQQNVAHYEQADVSGDGFVGLVVLAVVGVDELGDDSTGGPLGKGKNGGSDSSLLSECRNLKIFKATC
jgi:hypothetical protein